MFIYIKRGCSIFKNMHVDHVQHYMYLMSQECIIHFLFIYLFFH